MAVRPYYFVSVPRTASNSIHAALHTRHRHNHATIGRIVELEGAAFNRDAFAFAFVRNPWDRLVSWFEFHRQMKPHLSMYRNRTFADWVHASFPHHWHLDPLHQTPFVVGEGIEVEFVGRYENLKNDFGQICSRLGLPALRLKRLAATRQRQKYRECYASDTRDIVAHVFAEDIARFGYDY